MRSIRKLETNEYKYHIKYYKMKKLLFLFILIQSCITANAQMSRWVMQPIYDSIYIASGAPIIISDSAGTSTLWSFDGVKLSTTTDVIHPFKEGFAVTTQKGTDVITGFYDARGSFIKIKGCRTAYSYPYFRDGFLLVKSEERYKFIKPNGMEQDFGSFVKMYPFHGGYATCFAYKVPEKQKDPFYSYATIDNTAISFSYDNKVFDGENVQFLSSLTIDGKGIVIVKRKVYWFDKNTGALTPVFAKKDETNIKKQVTIDGDIKEYMVETEDSIIITGQGGKADVVRFYFNKMLKPTRIYYSDRIEEFKEESSHDIAYTSPISSIQDVENNKYGLKYNETVILPPQFEELGLFLNDFATVRSNEKWGMLVYNNEQKYQLTINDGKDIAFRHHDFPTTIRLELPTEVSSNNCRFDAGGGCVINKMSLEKNDTESGNYVQYKCVLTIPDSLPDVITEIQYPIQVTYDGLVHPLSSIKVKAWHYKYMNVDLDESETVVKQGNVSFTINILADRKPGENDYPFDVIVNATDSLKGELVKISETRYKCNLYALAEGVNSISINIVEKGCPPCVFPFEITYVKPVKKSRNKPEVKENVKIQKREDVKKPIVNDTPIIPI